MSKNFNLKEIYRRRVDKIVSYLNEHNIDAVFFHDSEDKREPALRYLTGHPTDAVLIITAAGKTILSPWDINLANERAFADEVIPYTNFTNSEFTAAKEILKKELAKGGKLVLPESTTYLDFETFKEALPDWELVCKKESLHQFVVNNRSVKDEYEIACTRKACEITSRMTDDIVNFLNTGAFKTESDVALFIEKRLREEGCERTSFDTLAAGPSRSHAIHAFPGYTSEPWGTKGLSILDYGVCYEGYASDCTITIARGPLSEEQTEVLDLVEKAVEECRKLYLPGKSVKDAANKADEIFKEAGKKMPHGLGHGTGLEIHEAPFVSWRAKEDTLFEPGNIVTLEPGLYDPMLGGCRLENDVLITESGNEFLTNSKIFRL